MKIKDYDLDKLRMDMESLNYGWAFYRFPNSKKVYFNAGYTRSSVFEDYIKPSFIVAPFSATQNNCFQIEEGIKFNLDTSEDLFHLPVLPYYYKPNRYKTTSKKKYCSYVENILEAIERRQLVKTVAAREKLIARHKNFSPVFFYKSLLNAYPNAFVYLLSTPLTGTWAGCSPELLLETNNNSVETVSLAGTKKIEAGQDGDITELFGDKELDEQIIVSKYIQATLEQHTSNIEAKGPKLITAGNVFHLATNFTAELNAKSTNYVKLLFDLHPTPAVCGIPKKEALKKIQIEEGFDRELYTGFLGPANENGGSFYVNLRCMQIHEKSFALYAGAGIVKGSDPDKEWLETEEKMNTLLRFL